MKNKRILICIVLVVLIIVSIIFIKKMLLFYEVKGKFLSSMLNASRNGNYHIVYSFKDKNGNVYNNEYYGVGEKSSIDGETERDVFGDSKFRIISGLFQVPVEYKITNIEKGKYEEKECYIITLENNYTDKSNEKHTDYETEKIEKHNDKIVYYVNPKTYLPYMQREISTCKTKTKGYVISSKKNIKSSNTETTETEIIYEVLEFESI